MCSLTLMWHLIVSCLHLSIYFFLYHFSSLIVLDIVLSISSQSFFILSFIFCLTSFFHVIFLSLLLLYPTPVSLLANMTQASAYDVCDHTHVPLHTPKTLEMCKKSMPCLIEKASRYAADHTFKTFFIFHFL